jgi:hypothetical protein
LLRGLDQELTLALAALPRPAAAPAGRLRGSEACAWRWSRPQRSPRPLGGGSRERDGTRHNVLTDADACGDYGVVWDINLTADIFTFFDSQDRRVKQVVHVTEDNTVSNTVTGLTLPDSPVNFVQTAFFDRETGAREKIFIVGTSVNVRRGNERLVDRGPILIDGQTGEILWSAGPHPARQLMDGSFDISLALPAFCDILE